MKTVLYKTLPVILFLLLWQGFSFFSSPLLLPSPLIVGKEFVLMFIQQNIGLDLFATLGRVLLSLMLALIIGLPLGLLLGYYQKLYQSLELLIDFGRSIPPVVLFPLFLLAFGIGEKAKIIPVAIAGSFYILINTVYGVRNVKKLRLDWAKSLGVSGTRLIWKVVLPEAMPYILTGIRITISVSLILILLFEMFVGTDFGLGQRIIDAQFMYKIPLMYALIVLSGLLGYSLNKLFLFYEQRKTHWWGR